MWVRERQDACRYFLQALDSPQRCHHDLRCKTSVMRADGALKDQDEASSVSEVMRRFRRRHYNDVFKSVFGDARTRRLLSARAGLTF
jgi:hypothetical protein